MPYADYNAALLYARNRAALPSERERKRQAMRRLRAERKARGEREHKPVPPAIRNLVSAMSAWREQ